MKFYYILKTDTNFINILKDELFLFVKIFIIHEIKNYLLFYLK